MAPATTCSTLEPWLALVIGNTRLHWGLFEQGELTQVWHTPHLESELATRLQASRFAAEVWQRVPELSDSSQLQQQFSAVRPRSIWIASVVPEQTAIWANRRAIEDDRAQISSFVVERSRIPLKNIYPTLGIDRAINLLGAGHTVGWPVLVVDAGTALTFTIGENQTVKGGAILPGVRLQAGALARKSAALVTGVLWSGERAEQLPGRWAMDTTGAIASGLIYGAISTLQDYLTDWWHQLPQGKVVLTGGDGPWLHALLQQKTPEIASRVKVDSHLMFWGMERYRSGAI